MFYNRLLKIAQIEKFLADKGFSQDIIDQVKSQPQLKKEVGKIVNLNPTITEEQLRQEISNISFDKPIMQHKKPTQLSLYRPEISTPEELEIVNNIEHEEYKSWILDKLRNKRNADFAEFKDLNKHRAINYEDFAREHFEQYLGARVRERINSIYDWFQFSYLPAKQELSQDSSPQKIAEITERYALPNPRVQLANLSLDEASNLSRIWHDSMEGKDSGIFYKNEKPEDIVYGPKWENQKFNGWTIKKVTTENNLKTEGEKMGHCVGSYCEKVSKGKSKIFSLRDPQNNPHVTMEVIGNYNFQQIFGPKNSDPKPEYKKAIGEWLKTLPNFDLPNYTDEELQYDTLDTDIEARFTTSNEEYGFDNVAHHADTYGLYEDVVHELNNYHRSSRRDRDGGPMVYDAAAAFARGLLQNYTKFEYEELNSEDKVKDRAFEIARIKSMSSALDRYRGYDLPKEILKSWNYYKNEIKKILPQDEERFAKLEEAGNLLQKAVANHDIDKERWRQYAEYSSAARFVEEAFKEARDRKKYTNITSFDDVPDSDQPSLIREAVDRICSIGGFLEKQQKNNEKLWQDMDFSYDEPEPYEEDFEDREEYLTALRKYEAEREESEEYYTKEVRSNNLPYNFDDEVLDELKKMAKSKKLSAPAWIVAYFAEKNATLPWCLQIIHQPIDKTSFSGWYKMLKMAEKWRKVQKIAPIYAITYNVAVQEGVVDDGKMRSDGQLIDVDDSFMICRDENCNIWAEKVEKFKKRYKKTDKKSNFWQKYEPTDDAINLAQKKSKENGYKMRENKKNGKNWEITNQEFEKNYKKV